MAQISRPRTGHDIHGRDDMTTGFGGTVQGVLIHCGFLMLLSLKMVEQNLNIEINQMIFRLINCNIELPIYLT